MYVDIEINIIIKGIARTHTSSMDSITHTSLTHSSTKSITLMLIYLEKSIYNFNRKENTCNLDYRYSNRIVYEIRSAA